MTENCRDLQRKRNDRKHRIDRPSVGGLRAPAGIALSAIAGTVSDNYVRCHENAEQLIALQAKYPWFAKSL